MSIVHQGTRFDRDEHVYVITSVLKFESINRVHPHTLEDYGPQVYQDLVEQLGRYLLAEVLGEDYVNTLGWLRYHLTDAARGISSTSTEAAEALDKFDKLLANIESFKEKVQE